VEIIIPLIFINMALNKLLSGDIIKVIMDLIKRIKGDRYNAISIKASRVLFNLE